MHDTLLACVLQGILVMIALCAVVAGGLLTVSALLLAVEWAFSVNTLFGLTVCVIMCGTIVGIMDYSDG